MVSSQHDELPRGFKMTELGPLPHEWNIAPLGAVFREVDIRAAEFQDQDPSSLPVLSLTKNYGLMLQSERFGKRIALQDVSAYKVVKRGEIVYNPYVIWEGAIHVLERFDYGLVSPVYPVLETKPGFADPYFLNPLLRTPLAISAYNRFAAGAVNRRRSIRKTDFMAIQIPLPPLPEQRAIAHVLSTIQQAIEAEDRIIAAARQLKKSLMHHLFTYGPVPVAEAEKVSLKETEIGPVPEHWEVVRLGETASRERYSFVDGPFGSNLKSIHYTKDGVLVIQSHYFTNGRFEIQNPTFTSKGKADELLRSNVKGGDIAIAKIGVNYGASAVVPDYIDRAVLSGNTMKLTVDAQIADRYFVAACLAFYKESGMITKSLSTKTAQPALTLSGMKSLRFPLPPVVEQQEIAAMLSSVDEKIEAEEKRKGLLQALFKTMLHQLMTGKVRVKDLEATAA